MNIAGLLTRHARYRPDHLALAVGDRRLTYRALNALVNRYANALFGLGLAKGDRFMTLLPNGLDLMALYWAAAKTGMVIVPASTLLQEGGIANTLVDSGSVAVVADPSFADVVLSVGSGLMGDRRLRVLLSGPADGTPPNGILWLEELVAAAPEAEPQGTPVEDDDVFNIMYSSGTTGAPKGIPHSHHVRAHYCTIFASAFRMTPESLVLHAGSIVFNGAMIVLMPWMYLGCRYVLHNGFDPAAVLADIEAEGATHMVMVPSQIIALLDHPDFRAEKLASLEMILSVGAPLHMEHKERLNALLPGRFYELYGLTEGLATVLDCADSLRKAGSVGIPLPFSEMKILDADGGECAAGEVGEICGRAPFMMTGYHQRPDLTAEAIVDGWLHTGDAGRFDEEGFLYLVDRIKDMIVCGGINVYPKDIEEVVIQHPGVAEVAVFGVPDDRWGEVPVAAVIEKPGELPDPKALIDWSNQRVGAKYQRLADVVALERFPRNLAGKTLKREIRAAYLAKRS
jgi:acyl-CoA synthetase (AMP-forming)/AMP-acid ligase II